jgi:hypothetical protein
VPGLVFIGEQEVIGVIGVVLQLAPVLFCQPLVLFCQPLG